MNIIDKGLNGHSVIQVEAEGMNRVIDNDYVLLLPIEENIKILDVPSAPITVLKDDTILPIQPLSYQAICRVNIVKNWVSITLDTSSVYYDFKYFGKPFEALNYEGPQFNLDLKLIKHKGEIRFLFEKWVRIFRGFPSAY
jgi:hypothetical protein